MDDQANDLRRLAREFAVSAMPRSNARSRPVVVTGGKGGVGTTTVAVNLAVALAEQGRRAVLVDADPYRADATLLCRAGERFTVAEVLSGQRETCEVLEPGPGGAMVLPGAWGDDRVWECSSAAQDRLIEELLDLGSLAEWVVIDAGNGAGRVAHRFWHAADRVLLVTTPDAASVLNAYTLVKLLAGGDATVPVETLVNMAPSAAVAEETHARLGRACFRFLGLRPQEAGTVPWSASIAEAGRRSEAFVLTAPRSPAARRLRALAQTLTTGEQSPKATEPEKKLNSTAAPADNKCRDWQPIPC